MAIAQILFTDVTTGSELARFQFLLRKWRPQLLIEPIVSMSPSQQRVEINKWLNELEGVFRNEQAKLNVLSGYSGWLGAGVGGVNSDIDTFVDSYKATVQALTGKDLSQARLLRNDLAVRMTDWPEMYAKYDDFAKESKSLGLSLRETTERFMNGEGREFTTLRDSAGRMWTPDNYADMYSRTRNSEMYDEILQDEMIAQGEDVVQISSHNTTTPICQLYEGKFFSLNGQTPGFPVMRIRPPFHPRCKHIAQPRPETNVTKARAKNHEVNVSNRTKASKLTTEQRGKQKASIRKQQNWIKENRPTKAAS